MAGKPLEWSAEDFRAALAKGRPGHGKLSIHDIHLLLGRCVRAKDLGHVSSWYRYASDDSSSGPKPFIWPIICRILDCDVESITRPARLIEDPDQVDWDSLMSEDEARPEKPKRNGDKQAS